MILTSVFSKTKLALVFATTSLMLDAVLGTVTYFILSSPKLKDNLVIKQDGQEIRTLESKDILVMPGSSAEYEVTLYASIRDNYKVYANFEMKNSAAAPYITTTISYTDFTVSKTLQELIDTGYFQIGQTLVDEENGVNVKVKYDFGYEIDQTMLVDATINVSFKINH